MYDDIPRPMKRYLRENGPHFNKELYEFAVSKMYKENDNGKNGKCRKSVRKNLVYFIRG